MESIIVSYVKFLYGKIGKMGVSGESEWFLLFKCYNEFRRGKVIRVIFEYVCCRLFFLR